MLERELEAKLVAGVRALGGQCLKWTSPGTAGVPDRIAILPGGRVTFIELKRPHGYKVGRLQLYWQTVLRRLGCDVRIIITRADLAALLEDFKEGTEDDNT